MQKLELDGSSPLPMIPQDGGGDTWSEPVSSPVFNPIVPETSPSTPSTTSTADVPIFSISNDPVQLIPQGVIESVGDMIPWEQPEHGPHIIGDDEPVRTINDVLGTPGTTFHTLENSPIGTNPDVVPSSDSPLTEITTLLDLFNNRLSATHAEPFTNPTQPGVTVIPTYESGEGSSNNSLLLYLALIGIVVTVGAHWYFNRKK